MLSRTPTPDHEAITGLRSLVEAMKATPCVPLATIARVPATLPCGVAVTVDFEASQVLGHEIIVLRMPAAIESPRDTRLGGLSMREYQIAGLVAEGLSNQEIARQLRIALATVKVHIGRVLRKTDSPNRAALAAAYFGGRVAGER